MRTNNIQFHNEIRKNPSIFVFFSNRKNFVGAQKRVRISQGKRAIDVRAIEDRMYSEDIIFFNFCYQNISCGSQLHHFTLEFFK